MGTVWAILASVSLVALTTALGLVWRARQGRVVTVVGPQDALLPAHLAAADGTEPVFGTTATLIQFSTEFCGQCPATSRLLDDIASTAVPGVTHVEIDLTHRADLADRYRVTQTPTTFVLDGSRSVRARIGGPPSRTAVTTLLNSINGENHVAVPA